MNSSLVIYIVVDTERCKKTWICYVTMLALNSENPYLPSAEIKGMYYLICPGRSVFH